MRETFLFLSDHQSPWAVAMDSETTAAAGASMEKEEASVKKHELVPQLQFPPGFHFQPTEEELVDLYLRGKIEGRKLPLDVINEVKLLEWQPGKLVEMYKAYGENKWYFFTKREPSSSNKEEEPNRKVKVPGVRATWKATGSLMVICRKGKPGDKIGTKRVLIYHSDDPEEDGKWSMHEYILTSNSQIGQYALYSIQRKQHSDTEPKTSGTSKRTRVTIDIEPGKTTKRKKAVSAQQQKQGTTPQHVPPQPPLTPQNADHRTPQQGSPPGAYAPTMLPNVPLQQGYPPDGNQQILGASAPMSAGHAQACCYDGDMAAQFTSQLTDTSMWSQSLPPDSYIDGAQYHQLYQQMENYALFGVPNQLTYPGPDLPGNVGFFPRDTTQNNSNWELGQDQIYHQQGVGDATGVQDLYPYGLQRSELPGHGAGFGHESDYGSHDQFTASLEAAAVASKGDDSVVSFSTDDFPGDLVDFLLSDASSVVDVPQHGVGGEQDGSHSALQGQQDYFQWLCGQQQQSDNGVDEEVPGSEFLS